MIFLTVGSDIPFPRLTKAFDQWCKENNPIDVFAQVGLIERAEDAPKSTEWADILPANEFDDKCTQAQIIVAHAGMGSILTALSKGKPIVMLPRREMFRETRSDHQFATAERFKSTTGVFVAADEHQLAGEISKALAFQARGMMQKASQLAPENFTDKLREFILHGKANA